jgi:hypothetical protein
MIRALLCCLALCAWALPAAAQQTDEADRMWFSVTVEPAYVPVQGAYVGGEIVMDVQFVSNDPFKRLRLEMPEIDGVIIKTLKRPHTSQVNVMGGKGYSHATKIVIIPKRAGPMVFPPIKVTGISEPRDGQNFQFRDSYPEQIITVHPADQAFPGDIWVVSRDVTIEDSWTPDLAAIHNGDTVQRRVAMTVVGVAADDLPDLTLTSNDGYRVLSTEVTRTTEKTDTGFVAHVEQTWDIYVETEEVTYIDAVAFPYWNPELAKTEVASAARQRIEPLPRDAMELREHVRAGVLAELQAKRMGLVGLIALPLAALLAFLAFALWRALPTGADLRFWRASKQPREALDFYGSYLVWGRQTFGPRSAVSREDISPLGPRATDQVTDLQRAIFGRDSDSIEPKRVAGTLIRASRRTTMRRFFAAIMPSLSRFLYLR